MLGSLVSEAVKNLPKREGTNLPSPSREILWSLLSLGYYTGRRDKYIDPKTVTARDSPYDQIFYNSTGQHFDERTGLETLLNEKLLLWLVEHLAFPEQFHSMFVVDRRLNSTARYGEVLVPFLQFSLRQGTRIVYTCLDEVALGQENPLLKMVGDMRDEPNQLYVVQIPRRSDGVYKPIGFDFAISEKDVFLGDVPPEIGQGNYSVKDSVILRDRLISTYRKIEHESFKSGLLLRPEQRQN